MAKDFAEQVERIGRKAELLATRLQMVEQRNGTLTAQVAELEERLRCALSELEKSRAELDFIRMGSVIAVDKATKAKAKALISDLVREIDACVDDLTKDI